MFGSDFYFGTIRKYVVLFGTLFNDVYITRTDGNNDPIETIKVPISYSPKETMLARLTQDPNLDRPMSIKLPRMGFEMNTLNYAPDRKLTTPTRIASQIAGSTKTVNSQYVPVPYDMSFSLFVMSKNAEDCAKIIEQILPYFTPEYTATVNLVPEMGIAMDIPVVLLNVTAQDTYETNFIDRRAIVWTLDFIIKGYFYGPVKKSGMIELASTNFFDSSLGFDQSEFLNKFGVAPGQTANGVPTTNADLTIAASQINPNSEYGIIMTRSGPYER